MCKNECMLACEIVCVWEHVCVHNTRFYSAECLKWDKYLQRKFSALFQCGLLAKDKEIIINWTLISFVLNFSKPELLTLSSLLITSCCITKALKPVSISPTFYKYFFCTKVFCAVLLEVQFCFVSFWCKEMGTKSCS